MRDKNRYEHYLLRRLKLCIHTGLTHSARELCLGEAVHLRHSRGQSSTHVVHRCPPTICMVVIPSGRCIGIVSYPQQNGGIKSLVESKVCPSHACLPSLIAHRVSQLLQGMHVFPKLSMSPNVHLFLAVIEVCEVVGFRLLERVRCGCRLILYLSVCGLLLPVCAHRG